MIHIGDNLVVMRGMPDQSVDLIATDPPYASRRDFGDFDDRWGGLDFSEIENAHIKALIEIVAVDDPSLASFMCFYAPRVVEMKRLLKPTGSYYQQCDDAASHGMRLLLNAVFGKAAFRNAITWKRATGKSLGNRWGRMSDRILFYANGANPTWNGIYTPLTEDQIKRSYRYEDEHGRYMPDNMTAPKGAGKPMTWKGATANFGWRACRAFPPHIPKPADWDSLTVIQRLDRLDDLGLILWSKNGRPSFKRYLSTSKGVKMGDFWPDPVNIQATSKEATGWATQKPVALYERIIRASSNPGDMVFDPFCGSGTTLVAAQRLGREWIGCDLNPDAKAIIEGRLE